MNYGMTKSKNSSLTSSVVDFASLADATRILLGVDSRAKFESIAKLSKDEVSRATFFRDNCGTCKNGLSVSIGKDISICGVERGGDDDPHTPPQEPVVPQMEENDPSEG
jgi:hypothetical protein